MRYYARACPPTGGTPLEPERLFTWFTRARDYYFSQSRAKFEAITFGLTLLVGLFIMPALIYLAGRYALMAYANGGVFALYSDFFKGLFELRQSCWIVAAGPYLILSMIRVFRLILRKL
jgi:hypothetical protein